MTEQQAADLLMLMRHLINELKSLKHAVEAINARMR